MSDTNFRFAVLTVSDSGSAGERAEDASGDAIVEMMEAAGLRQADRRIVPDEKADISARLIQWCDSAEVDVVLTTGGTGLGPRDVTPEPLGRS